MLIEEAAKQLVSQRGAVDVSAGPRTADRIVSALIKHQNGNLEDIIIVSPHRGKWTIEELQENIVNVTQRRVDTIGHLIIQDAHQATPGGHDFLLRTVEEPNGTWLLWFCRPKDSVLPTALRSRMTNYVDDTTPDDALVETVAKKYNIEPHVAKTVCELLLDPLNMSTKVLNSATILADPQKLMNETVTDAASQVVEAKLWASLDVSGRNKARRVLVDTAHKMSQFCIHKASLSEPDNRGAWLYASESWAQAAEGITVNIAPNVAWNIAKKQTPDF